MIEKKAINKVKLFVTTNCNMFCPYCMIKNTHEYMTSEMAIEGVEKMIFGTPGDTKKFIYFFGGEPLLNFKVIKDTVLFVNKFKTRVSFPIIFVICTNFTLVTQEIIDFIIEHNIFLSVSLGGTKKLHDAHRILTLQGQKSSFDMALLNISKIKKTYQREKVGVGFVIVKKDINELLKNFLYIVNSLGLNHLNFEVVLDNNPWLDTDYYKFAQQYKKIMDYILIQIEQENFIFINTLNWKIMSLLTETKQYRDNEPYLYLTELYPSGEIMFAGFYTHSEEKSSKIVGHISHFNDEFFSQDFTHYFDDLPEMDGFLQGEGYKKIKEFGNYCELKLSEKIVKLSQSNHNFLRYIEKVQEIYF